LNAQSDALSALAWWQMAGVDTLVDDVPRNWLGADAKTSPAAPPPVAAPAAAHAMPDTLPAFREWLAHASHAAIPAGPRVLPAGSLDSGLMLICAQPEIGERDRLFDGVPGTLLDAMLAAIGLTRGSVYVASISPVHLPGRSMPAVQQELLALTRHHIALAAPRRLAVIGDSAAQLLLGGGVVATRGRLHHVNHSSGMVAALSTFHPRLLLTTPARKADTWRDLRLLLEELGR
jgi:uracil-DNA glycosylase family 4